MTRRLLIDTDPGTDDPLAILLALASPETRLEAVTVVAGNVAVDLAMANARRILAVAAPSPMPPVVRGAEAPLQRALVTAGHVRGQGGLGNLDRFVEPDGRLRYPEPPPVLETRSAAQVILETVDRWGPERTLVALGPLTSRAAAAALDARRLARVGRVVVMGGAVTAPGNVTPAAGVDVYADPAGAGPAPGAG